MGKHYASTKGRTGVVRIQDGDGKRSKMKSNEISMEYNPFSRMAISFSFYAVELELIDGLCVSYQLDNKAVTGVECWDKDELETGVWYDNMPSNLRLLARKT